MNMGRNQIRLILGSAMAAVIAMSATPITAGQWKISHDSSWCKRSRADFCEVREITIKGRKTLTVDASRNGGIGVEGWDQDEIMIEARITVDTGGDEDRAEDIGNDIEISISDVIQAEGPRRRNWSVSYKIMVPHEINLQLDAHNGGVSITAVEGKIRVETTNGGLSLAELAGDVHARTTNGGLNIELSGDEWNGKGLDAQSTNGGVTLAIPDGYSADLRAGTVNGGIQIDFPMKVRGRISKSIKTVLGDGGAPIRVTTTNGGVKIYRD